MDFWNSTPIEIYHSLEAYSISKLENIKESWEQMRIQTYYLINIQVDKKYKMDYNKFKRTYLPFAWDEDKPKEAIKVDWEARDKLHAELARKTLTSIQFDGHTALQGLL